MHPASSTAAFAADIRQRLRRAEERQDHSRTDAEYEANRQIVIWLKAELEAIGRKAVA